jgi:hypothetical protein
MCWLEQHKDALLVIAALASPFAAVFAALIASKRSATATIAAADKQRQTSLEIAERNTRITVRATNRQNWINELRQEIAGFLSLLPAAHGVRKGDPTFDRVAIQQELMLHRAKIDLLINPQKTDYNSFQHFIDDAMRHAGDSLEKNKADLDALADDVGKIVEAAQRIFRKQWERVKNLE